MEPLYNVLLAIFTGVTYLFLSVFRQPAAADAVKKPEGKRGT